MKNSSRLNKKDLDRLGAKGDLRHATNIKTVDINKIPKLELPPVRIEEGDNSAFTIADYNNFDEKNKLEMPKVYHDKAQNFFDNKQAKLQTIYDERGEGAVRNATGKLYEELIDEFIRIKQNGFMSKTGTNDYISTKYEHPTMGVIAEQNNLQVDRHIWKNGLRYAFIEAKTYLDKPYLERAVSDFLEIKRALEMQGESTKELKFLVFAGQNALSDNSLKVQKARFWTESSPDPSARTDMHVFFITKGKRKSSKPLYSNKFDLNYDEITRFIKEFD